MMAFDAIGGRCPGRSSPAYGSRSRVQQRSVESMVLYLGWWGRRSVVSLKSPAPLRTEAGVTGG
jgi:hypothetical protein